jgi:hypothetical protein
MKVWIKLSKNHLKFSDVTASNQSVQKITASALPKVTVYLFSP